MEKITLFGEGIHDVFFLDELLISSLGVSRKEVKYYDNLRDFQLDISSNKLSRISIAFGNGSECSRTIFKFLQFFWYMAGHDKVLVLGDTDTGFIYDKIAEKMETYLLQRQPLHSKDPVMRRNDDQKVFSLSFQNGRVINVWTHDVPISLEIEIAKCLKNNYNWIPPGLNEDDTIEAVSQKLRVSTEDVIRISVPLVQRKNWCNSLCQKLVNEVI